MKTLKENFITYFGKDMLKEFEVEYKVKYVSKSKFNYHLEVFVNNFKEPIVNYFLCYKNEFHLNFKNLSDDLLIMDDFSNEKYLNLLSESRRDILKNFRNKKLKSKLEKKFKIKNIKTEIKKI